MAAAASGSSGKLQPNHTSAANVHHQITWRVDALTRGNNRKAAHTPQASARPCHSHVSNVNAVSPSASGASAPTSAAVGGVAIEWNLPLETSYPDVLPAPITASMTVTFISFLPFAFV